ncbi:MAG TPA: EAL domain-containing protein [Burkholderiaceae bacterium]|nr:EAL domain-containing protein [Burkholderiaceae bacterium]
MWLLITLASGIIGWTSLLHNFNQEKKRIEEDALIHTAALSRSYAARLNRTFEGLDQIILHVKYEWELSGGKLQLETVKEKGLFPQSSLFFAAIVDPAGRVSTSTAPGGKGTVVEERPYFFVQKNATSDSLYIDAPTTGKVIHRKVMQLSRRLANADGSFAGVALVSVSLEYFTIYYDEAALGGKGFLGIVGNDGITRTTRTGALVNDPNSEVLLATPRVKGQSGSMLMEGNEWFRDGRSRYVGWSFLDNYPMTAMVGMDQESIMSRYWAERAASIRKAILTTTIVAALTLVVMMLSMRLLWRKRHLEKLQATYRMATEGGNEGFFIIRPVRNKNHSIIDFRIVDSNNRGAELLRYRHEDLIGATVSTFYHGADRDCIIRLLSDIMEQRFYEGEVEAPANGPIMARWLYLKIICTEEDLAIAVRDISDSKAHVEELERRSNEDALTGLPNRHWVQTFLPQAVKQAEANDGMLALLFIDLDGFKTINDTMGHQIGDELLQNAARRLKVAVRPQDHVVRLGGDEFVVVLENLSRKADAAHVAERVIYAFKDSFRLSQGAHSVGTSIGISVFPSDGTDADTLLKNADIAMYSVKSSGKGSYRFYDQRFYETLRIRSEKEAELRHAIEHDQFTVYYQPRVNIITGTVASMEALVRWVHPARGVIEPLDFIPLAEETGVIVRLGEMVIDKVCAQLALWAKSREDLVLMPVSINVSPRQFNESDIAQTFATALQRHNIDPRLVEIELTESSMLGCGENITHMLESIHQMGIKLLVDDFGTGYSSLSQLQQMDFDVLKVDRAFTSEIEKSDHGNVFFSAIITMAHALGMRVVAEGVENERQIRILKSLHCDEIQGFYISKPLPPAATQPILPKWFFPSTA